VAGGAVVGAGGGGAGVPVVRGRWDVIAGDDGAALGPRLVCDAPPLPCGPEAGCGA
jgi:hypothetical protein